MESPPLTQPTTSDRPRPFSLALKLAAICLLMGFLLVGLHLVDGVRRERLRFRDEARAEVARAWGGEQLLAGPVLVVPCSYAKHVVREVNDARGVPVRNEAVETVHTNAVFLPDDLSVVGRLDVSLRYRGIFNVPLYEAPLQLRGRFRPEPGALGVEGVACHWEKARVLLALSFPRGLRTAPVLALGGQACVLDPVVGCAEWGEALGAPVALDASTVAAGISFSADLTLQGCARFAVAPVGAQTRMELHGNWADPSFGGATLPVRRSVGAGGFTAEWQQSYFSRGYPRQWLEDGPQTTVSPSSLAGSACEVALLQPVDAYRLVERALKYGVLFLVLVFANFFLFEVTARLRIHPLQYLMVGAALVLFFLGYLALSEWLPSALAYGVAAVASTVLVGGYSASVLQAGRRSLVVGGGLAGTYAYLYFILQLQDFALLAGAAALFALLAVAMWATRKVDWYAWRVG